MKLKVKKFKFISYMLKALVANFLILGFMFLFTVITKMEGEHGFANYREILGFIDSFLMGIFIICISYFSKLINGGVVNA